jgi:hypothetical protein
VAPVTGAVARAHRHAVASTPSRYCCAAASVARLADVLDEHNIDCPVFLVV